MSTTRNYLCSKGHKVIAPYHPDRCPVARCLGSLTLVGPNWGALRSKTETQEHYEALEEEAKQS